jgi:predicted metal-dependent phosphoesterase TrpH
LIKADFHLHTLDDPWDRHVDHKAEELLDKAQKLGYQVLALTLHGRQFECEKLVQEAHNRGIRLIPGVEQNIAGAHVLMLGFPGEIADRIRTYPELRQARVDFPHGLVIAAHPYFPQKVCVGDALLRESDVFDAVEWTGFYHRWWNPNQKARTAAEKLKLPVIGNSDTHTLEQFGKTWTELPDLPLADDGLPDVTSVLNALRKGLGQVVGSPLSVQEMSWIVWRVIVRGYLPIDSRKRRRHKPEYWKQGQRIHFPVR